MEKTTENLALPSLASESQNQNALLRLGGITKQPNAMTVNVADLRKRLQVNWLVPYEWMTKMSNDELHEWEASVIDEETQIILAENRPTWNDPEWNKTRIDAEVVARVRDRARLVQIDYEKITLG